MSGMVHRRDLIAIFCTHVVIKMMFVLSYLSHNDKGP
jgi:hypothetical protein